jgi:hypothetical protein
MEQQAKVTTKRFKDGRLVEVTAETIKRRKHDEILEQTAALKAQHTLTFDIIAELHNEVRSLRAQLLRAEHLAKVRTRERDAVRAGHRHRLRQVHALKERNEELKTDLLVLQEDIAAGAFPISGEDTTPMRLLEDDERPRGVAARAVRK